MDTKISNMTAASTLGGTELAAGVQSSANVKITIDQIKTWTSNAPTLVTPALGTPASGVLTNCTGYPATGLSGVTGAANGGTGIANNAASTITISGSFATTLTVSGITGVTLPTTGTLATLAGTEEFTNKTLNASVGKGTWTASGTWTLPAHTLGGTVSGGGNQLNNIIIGTSTPLAGTFTALTCTSGSHTGLTTFALRDTSAAFDVTVVATSSVVLDAGRILTLNMGNVAHTLNLGTSASTVTFPTGTVTLVDSTVATLSSLASVGTLTTGAINWAGAITTSGVITTSNSTTASPGNVTGALIVAGGAGIGGTLYAQAVRSYVSAGSLQIALTAQNDNNGSSGAALGLSVNGTVAGETLSYKAGIALIRSLANGRGDLYICNNVTDGTSSFTTSDAVIQLVNGNGTFNNSYVKILPTLASTSTTTGALTVAGGLGVAGAQFIAGAITYTVAASGPVLKQGANGRVGTFVANGTTPVTVNNTSVAITDTIIISLNTIGGVVTLQPFVGTITAASGFTAVSGVGDTSTWNYCIIKNAA